MYWRASAYRKPHTDVPPWLGYINLDVHQTVGDVISIQTPDPGRSCSSDTVVVDP